MGYYIIFCGQTVRETVDRDEFLQKWLKVAKLFLPGESLMKVVNALENEMDIPVYDLNQLIQSHLGLELFQTEAHAAQWTEFVKNGASLLKNLMHLNFAADEDESFQTRMRDLTAQLVSSGHKAMEKDEDDFMWCGFQIGTPVMSINDYWGIPRYAALVACFINRGLVPRMPWEDLLLGLLSYDSHE